MELGASLKMGAHPGNPALPENGSFTVNQWQLKDLGFFNYLKFHLEPNSF